MELVLRGGDLARVGDLLRTVEVLAQDVVRALGLAQRVGGRFRVDARLGRDRAALVHQAARDVARVRGHRRDRHRPGQLVVGRAAGEAADGPRDGHRNRRRGRGRCGAAGAAWPTGGRGRTATPGAVGPTSTTDSGAGRGDGAAARRRDGLEHGDGRRSARLADAVGPRAGGRPAPAPWRASVVAPGPTGTDAAPRDRDRDRAGRDTGRPRWNGRSTRRCRHGRRGRRRRGAARGVVARPRSSRRRSGDPGTGRGPSVRRRLGQRVPAAGPDRVRRDRDADLAAGCRSGTERLDDGRADARAEDEADGQEGDLGWAHVTPCEAGGAARATRPA